MKRHALWLGAAVVAGLVLILASTGSTRATEGLDGKELFLAEGCDTCHSVAAAEIEAKTTSEKMLGPDVSGYETDDLKALAAYLRKEAELDGETHNKGFKGSDEELQALIDWLGSLEPPAK
ncbi:MAG: cytochrome c [Acidobacteriota bacterium]|nr:cytochrome c [Acidobacteriota bacterium]MDH3522333.1 cytochrome c [Acidobacteriota bacterium]